MRILVTGSQGTLGKLLMPALEGMGHNVTGIDLTHSHRENQYRCDVAHFGQLAEFFDTESEFDMVFHLAAEFGRHNGEDFTEQLWMSNAIGTKNILKMQAEHDFRLVFFSSSEIYGECGTEASIFHSPAQDDPAWDGFLRESYSDDLPLFPTNDYAISKWVNELQIRNWSVINPDLRTMVVRLFNAYGPGETYTPY